MTSRVPVTEPRLADTIASPVSCPVARPSGETDNTVRFALFQRASVGDVAAGSVRQTRGRGQLYGLTGRDGSGPTDFDASDDRTGPGGNGATGEPGRRLSHARRPTVSSPVEQSSPREALLVMRFRSPDAAALTRGSPEGWLSRRALVSRTDPRVEREG